METHTQSRPRERLLAAAKDLTYSQGVGVGVDAILKKANVARRSLYEHFGGKDGLIAEVLRMTTDEDEALYRATMQAAGDDPRARLLAIFDWLGEVVKDPDFRGCRYLSVDLALTDPDHPAHAITRQYSENVKALLEAELAKLGHHDPAEAANELMLLIDGTLAAGVTKPSSDPARLARRLAEQVITP
ncbi:TetR/AcrR family transcriptional regulator [Tenggerimyces flavus]|uniref:TetR/AcrR family transcriptional regulator n=1 Tax=Tenggerimyces flavus TaxID=1708749 RepID=A0ABV7YB85_9ACTN|nr:TetR/AcrR family transcriptional regulator [Tenggerimyces flavus]MBM7789762.1 AcrR family transcriptional regulator [Tenggerimyces flavus]